MYRTRRIPFNYLHLEAKGNPTLARALEAFVEGETIDGVGDRKITVTRRERIAEAPQTIVLNLNRHNLDFENFESVKCFDWVAIPMDLDLAPYCVDRLGIPMGTTTGTSTRKRTTLVVRRMSPT